MLELATASTIPPISLDDAKEHLRITHTHEDDLINRLITMATGYVEQRLERALINTTWREWYRGLPTSQSAEIRPSISPLSSVTAIKYYDETDTLQTWSNTEYDVITPRHLRGIIHLVPGCTWPSFRSDRNYPVYIDYVAGYGSSAAAIPEEIRQILYLVIDDAFRFRGASVSMPMSEPLGAALNTLLAQQTGVNYP